MEFLKEWMSLGLIFVLLAFSHHCCSIFCTEGEGDLGIDLGFYVPVWQEWPTFFLLWTCSEPKLLYCSLLFIEHQYIFRQGAYLALSDLSSFQHHLCLLFIQQPLGIGKTSHTLIHSLFDVKVFSVSIASSKLQNKFTTVYVHTPAQLHTSQCSPVPNSR